MTWKNNGHCVNHLTTPDKKNPRLLGSVTDVDWPDLRSNTPLEYTDIRDLHGGRAYYLRLRKTFS